MKIEKVSKDSFVVIGKEGSTLDGDGFIQRLWQNANTHCDEIRWMILIHKQRNCTNLWDINALES